MSEYYGYYEAPNDFRNYIQHFGILGMKWGIRRYQNPDGTLTPLGRKRYGTAENMDNERKYARQKIRNLAVGAGVGAGLGVAGLGTPFITPIGAGAFGAAGGLSLISQLNRTNNPYQYRRLSKEQIKRINERYEEQQNNASKTKGKRSEEAKRLGNEVSKLKGDFIPKSKVSSALKDALRQVNKPGYSPVKLTNSDVLIKQMDKDHYIITAETEDGHFLEFEYDANNKRALYPSVNG